MKDFGRTSQRVSGAIAFMLAVVVPQNHVSRFMSAVILLLMLTSPGVLNDASSTKPKPRPTRIAIIKPVFTAAAYGGYPDKSFYGFFRRYSSASAGTIVKTDLNLLNTTVNKEEWGQSSGLAAFLKSEETKEPFKDTIVLTDIDVNNGALFDSGNGSRRYDVAVLGFSEYVTLSEYENYRHFVETGGGLFFLDATSFLAEVRYNSVANTVSLVKGKGWEFNGTAAWKGPYQRWPNENANWIGSNFALFRRQGYQMNGAIANTTHPLSILLRNAFGKVVFASYASHEENAIMNSSVKVIAYWNISGLKSSTPVVAIYEHNYRLGVVIHTGIVGSDIIGKDHEMQFFLRAAVRSLGFHRGPPNLVSVPQPQVKEKMLTLAAKVSKNTKFQIAIFCF